MNRPRRAFKRRRFGWRRIHKWIGVGGGVLLLIWIVSGIFISWPGGGRARLQSEARPPDFRSVHISPAEAISALGAEGAAVDDVRSVALALLGSRPIYSVRTAEGVALVDAVTGLPFEIDAREASRIANEVYGGPGAASPPVLVESRELRYFQGELPAFRIEFDDDHNTEIYIGQRTGTVMWWDTKSRTRRWMGSAHDLWPIGPLLGSIPRLVAMVGGGLITLAIALSGYWLAWRRGGWRLTKRRPTG